ncbi:MAG: nitric oxide reductase transcriptional regulator NorR [Planctomycetes bacterium]|nr:nitric oxide reductase transcriptional regulator NorR [Planctomycetota bacterium]
MKPIPPRELELLFQISIDLSASFSSRDRHQRLVEAVETALPVDAVTLMRHDGGVLWPVAQYGLSRDALGRDFPIDQHPRLQEIVQNSGPTIFPHDSPLPDPFDGLIEGSHALTGEVHACVGCPLFAEGKLIGVLTLDALEPRPFGAISPAFFSSLSALAGASLRTALLIEELEAARRHQDLVASDQIKASRERFGANLIGDSPELALLKEEIEAVGPSDLPVLITGETGSGKEPTVRLLHGSSDRAEKPLIYVNCAALPESLAESELFGHTAGSFTDAKGVRMGKFQLADGASLFLDEIGELPLSIQPKLLRVLQSGEVQRVGSDEPIVVDVRLFAATNRDLREGVKAGRFRADLLHRLDVCRVHVPSLKNHQSDIPLIAGHFCEGLARRLGCGPIRMEPAVLESLDGYPWPGNVRELKNVISRAVLRAKAQTEGPGTVVLTVDHLGAEFRQVSGGSRILHGRTPSLEATGPTVPSGSYSLREAVDEFQVQCVRRALESSDWVWSRAASSLGMHRANFHRLATRLGFRRPKPGPGDVWQDGG